MVVSLGLAGLATLSSINAEKLINQTLSWTSLRQKQSM